MRAFVHSHTMKRASFCTHTHTHIHTHKYMHALPVIKAVDGAPKTLDVDEAFIVRPTFVD